MSKQTSREHAQQVHAEKQRVNRLGASDLGAYGKAIGVLPRYLVGSQWNPSKKRRSTQ